MNFEIRNNQDLMKLINTRLLIQDIGNQYIHISELPNYFGEGKNSFLIGIKQNCFVSNSILQIFFIDAKYNAIPVQVTHYKQRKMIRCYVEIKQGDNIGFGTLVLIGTLQNYSNGKPVDDKSQNKYNIKFQKTIYVNPYQSTPSVLRFETKPIVKIQVDQKDIYTTQMTTIIERVPIKDITVINKNRNTFHLQIDTEKFTDSIFHQKFLNYKIVTSSFDEAQGDYKNIFSGNTQSTMIPKGKYKGKVIYQGSIDLDPSFTDLTMTQGKLTCGEANTVIHRLYGNDVLSFKSSKQPSRALPPPITPAATKNSKVNRYSIYAEGKDYTSSQVITLGQGQSITPISFISFISEAKNLSMKTNYFTGSIFDSNGQQVFAQSFMVDFDRSYEINWVWGHKEDPLIKDPKRKIPYPIEQNYPKQSHIFSGSNYTLSSTGNTILNGVNVFGSYFMNDISDMPTTFTSITAQLFAKKIMTKFCDDGTNYFTGSLIGDGDFIVKTSGSKYTVKLQTKIYDKDSKIEIDYDGLFVGEGYNVNVDAKRFSGSIYNGSLIHLNNMEYNQTHSNVHYHQYKIQADILQVDLKNLNNLQISVPAISSIPSILQIQINGGSLYVSSEGGVKLSPYIDLLKFSGNFNISADIDPVTSFVFDGLYQNDIIDSKFIQQYDFQNVALTSKYQKIFNTSEVFFKNNQYDCFNIPIAIKIDESQLPVLLKQLQDQVTKQSIVQLQYTIINETQPAKKMSHDPIIPINVVMSNIEIYSGQFGAYEVYSADTPPYDNYQLLSVIQVGKYKGQDVPKNEAKRGFRDTSDEGSGWTITKSLDLPMMGFSGQTTNLKIKYLDGRGNYCPQQFFSTIYGLEIDSDYLEQLRRSYSISYFDQNYFLTNIDPNNVLSVNSMVGNVILRAQNIPFNLGTVYSALTYLYDNVGGGSSVGAEEAITFNEVDVFQIGNTQTNHKFGWSRSPLIDIVQYNWTVSIAKDNYYDDQYVFSCSGTSSRVDPFCMISNLATSAKIDVEVIYNQNYSRSYTGYVQFKNGIYCVTDYIDSFNLDNFKTSAILDNDYQNIFTVEPLLNQYIWFACPTRMISDKYSPQFVVNGIVGGFEKYGEIPEYKNQFDYVEGYTIYNSSNHTLGETVLQVRDPIKYYKNR